MNPWNEKIIIFEIPSCGIVKARILSSAFKVFWLPLLMHQDRIFKLMIFHSQFNSLIPLI